MRRRLSARRAEPGATVAVTLVKDGAPFLVYPAEVLFDDGEHVVVAATWAETSERDVGYVRFEHRDAWTEHYWRSRWYAVKEIRRATGELKGWYCDVARPATLDEGQLRSDDLYLDLWVSGNGATVLRLDEDEFIASGLIERDPEAADAARRALDELELLARDRFRGIIAQ